MIKTLIKQIMSTAPGWQGIGALTRPRGVRILMYHRIGGNETLFPHLDVNIFRSQMRWLRRNCTIISPEELDTACANPRISKPPVLVTFDDGYRDYHDTAYPVLKQLGIPSVVFLATDMIDGGGLVWTDIVYWAFHTTGLDAVNLPWDMTKVDLDGTAARNRAVALSKKYLKGVDDGTRRLQLDDLLDRLGVAGKYRAIDRQMLSWDEVRATMDITFYGGHTHTHPIMSRLNAEELEAEIATCRNRITAETGVVTPYFAYPNGTKADFNDETKRALKRHGFNVVFSTIEGVNGTSPDFMELMRLPTSARNNADFSWLVAG
jgi:peptidoglycan/xylan/chitin deacetylase (PgdA/CDA1 family)